MKGPYPPRDGASGNHGRRAVSDTIGFVMILSLILVTIGMVYVAGIDSVGTMRSGEQLQNAERTFETIERNFDDIERRQAPSRAAEINLNGGTVLVDESSSIRINVTGASFDRTVDTGIFSYRLGTHRIDYENGAVVRSTDGTSVVLTDAKLECGKDVAIISVVTLAGTGGSVTGTNVVTVYNRRVATGLAYPTNRSGFTPEGVEVEVTSSNADGWNAYLENEPGWSDPDGDGTFSCSRVDEVFVRITEFQLTFQT